MIKLSIGDHLFVLWTHAYSFISCLLRLRYLNSLAFWKDPSDSNALWLHAKSVWSSCSCGFLLGLGLATSTFCTYIFALLPSAATLDFVDAYHLVHQQPLTERRRCTHLTQLHYATLYLHRVQASPSLWRRQLTFQLILEPKLLSAVLSSVVEYFFVFTAWSSTGGWNLHISSTLSITVRKGRNASKTEKDVPKLL